MCINSQQVQKWTHPKGFNFVIIAVWRKDIDDLTSDVPKFTYSSRKVPFAAKNWAIQAILSTRNYINQFINTFLDLPLARSSTSSAISANNSCNNFDVCDGEAKACTINNKNQQIYITKHKNPIPNLRWRKNDTHTSKLLLNLKRERCEISGRVRR